MKKTKILYWTFTLPYAFMMFGSAIPDVFSAEIAVKGIHTDLGYPIYFVPFIGVAKWLGVIAILIPGFPRIKEWAYAGLMFDLIGATYSIIAIGGPVANWAPMVLPITLGILSYTFYHKKLKFVSLNSQTIKTQQENGNKFNSQSNIQNYAATGR